MRRTCNWIYMVNYGMLRILMNTSTIDWIIPLVYGNFTSLKVRALDGKILGYFFTFERRSINELTDNVNTLFYKNILGTPAIRRIDLLLDLIDSSNSASTDWIEMPNDGYDD